MKNAFYFTIILTLILQVQSSLGMAPDFSLDPIWESSLWNDVKFGKIGKAIRALQFLDDPEKILNETNKNGDTLLMVALNRGIAIGKNPLPLIKFILSNYDLNLNIQDAHGNTFLMNALELYNDNVHKFENATVGSVIKEIANFILKSEKLRSRLDLDLRNKQSETIRDIAIKVELEPHLAKLINVNISSRKRGEGFWSSLITSSLRSFAADNLEKHSVGSWGKEY